MATLKTTPARRNQQISPYLLYQDVSKALDWFTKAFGFMEVDERYMAEGRRNRRNGGKRLKSNTFFNLA